MRIISQGSHADLPYERTSLCLDGNHIIARCDGKEYLMGVYSSEKKASYVMGICAGLYSRTEFNKFTFDADMMDVLTEEQQESLMMEFVYRFPEDEDVDIPDIPIQKVEENQPIAYDTEKVVEQLQKISDEAQDRISPYDLESCQYDMGISDGVDKAIDIVKRGGRDGK